MSVVSNLRDYVDSFENDLHALFNKIDDIICQNFDVVNKFETDAEVEQG